MTFTYRRTVRFGPLRLNLSPAGPSVTLKVGPWSYNTRSRSQRVDLPGPFAWRGRKHSR